MPHRATAGGFMKKATAIFLYAVYAISMTVLLCFGRGVATGAVSAVRTIINAKHIEDVTLDIDTEKELLAAKTYYIEYTAHGKFSTDAGLMFESLDPELLKVTSSGSVYAYNKFEGDSIEASYKITSKYDEDFEKTVTLRFARKYPENFRAVYSLEGVGSTKKLYVGVPVYVYSSVASGQTYNVSSYDILYDEEYFSYDEERRAYIPIKATASGETKTFTVSYANGATAESAAFQIAAAPKAATDFDEIRLNNKSSNAFEIGTKKTILVSLYKNGKRVITDFDISLGDGEGGSVNRAGRILYSSAGPKEITVTLPNGYSKTVALTVNNIMKLPKVEGITLNEDGAIEMLDSEVMKYRVRFPNGVTYSKIKLEYDKELVTVSYSSKTLKITPKSEGESTFKIIIDDGYRHLEESYRLKVIKDTSIKTWIRKNLAIFVTKFLGHMSMFALLAAFSINMFKYIEEKNPIKRFLAYTMTALPIALLTEFIQRFIPRRTSALIDVLIDMIGFYIGTVITVTVIVIVNIIAFGKRTVYRTKH